MDEVEQRFVLPRSQFVVRERVRCAEAVSGGEPGHDCNLVRVDQAMRACMQGAPVSLEETNERYPKRKMLPTMGELASHALI